MDTGRSEVSCGGRLLMMKILRTLAVLLFSLVSGPFASAQIVNAAQQVTLAGLRSSGGQGSFLAAAYAADGTLFLLYDQKDGVRVLKLNAAGTQVLAQATVGAAGDSGLALCLDPAGNVYVAGTSTSGLLGGTTGSAFPTRADASINSFIARFDAALNLNFVTFLGAGRTSVTGLAATADAIFVTGLTFSTSFPVTVDGVQQAPANGATQNGFVERFDSRSGALVYATYLSGANGITAPTGIVADAGDAAYITGYTSASGFPTVAALVPEILGSSSGFLTRLSPAGDALTFSTFIPGGGVTGLALDTSSQTLLLTGSIALGQFPIASTPGPLGPTAYQSLLRIPIDGQSVSASTLLLPGSQSFVAVGPGGTAWVTGSLGAPVFPGSTPPLATLGDSFALHLTAANAVDQTVRLGGQPAGIFGNTSLTSVSAAPAIAPGGVSAAFPATLTAILSPALAATQRFDLPTVQTPNSSLPSSLRDLAAACTGTDQCFQTSAYLALLSTAASAPSLSVSYDNAPNLIIRNLGSDTADGVVLIASGPMIASNCSATLAPSAACSAALTGTGAGSFMVSAANAATESVPLPATRLTPSPLVTSPAEIDFGIQTAGSPAATRVITVTNLGATTQTFTSALDSIARTLPYTIAESASDCPTTGAGLKTLNAGASCHVTLNLAASANATNDGAFRAAWKVAGADVTLTGITQSSAYNVSSAQVDFGTQFQNGLRLPRYLFLSNNSTSPISHAAVSLNAGTAFSIVDECPSTLGPFSVCRIRFDYLSEAVPSTDSTTVTLNQGLSILLTGRTLPQQGTTGSSANPSLSVTPQSLTFADPVVTTGVSNVTQSIVVKNTGNIPLPLSATVSGDFTIQNGCPATLSAGSSCQVIVRFAPSQPGARQGLITLSSNASFAPVYVPLNGNATALLPANNATLDLGETLVGEPLIAWYKVQQPISLLTVASSSPLFGVAVVEDAGYGHGSLAPSAFASTVRAVCSNCWIGIQFLAQTPSTQTATLSLGSVLGGSSYTLALTATALPVSGLLLTPATQDFGTVAVNSSSAPQLFALANLLTPGASVSITSATASGDFSVVANSSGGPSCTGSLASAASCFVQVVFTPTAVGLRNGKLTLMTSAGRVSATLTGTAAADPGLAISPVELDFDNVPGTSALQQSIFLSNTSAQTLSVVSIASTDASFSPSSNCSALPPNGNCAVSVEFHPGLAPVAANLVITVRSTVNNQPVTATYAVALAGRYTSDNAGLQLLPSSTNFGPSPVGTVGQTRLYTLNNLTSKAIAVSLALPRQFPLSAPGACSSLSANGSCTFSVSFVPSTGGQATGTIFAHGTPADGSAPLQALAYAQAFGTSSGVLSITGNLIPNSPLQFGEPNSGQSSQQALTLSNGSSSPLTIHRITSQLPFLSTSTCGASLAPAQSCTVTVTYAPVDQVTASGTPPSPRADSGTLTIESDAASSPDIINLAGNVMPTVSASSGSGAALATFNLSQGALTFATTGVGNASAPQTITLTNAGTLTLHVLETLVPTDFAATSNCSTLLPGEACTYSIAFQPTASSTGASRLGALGIRTDAATSLEFVTLIGTSSAPALAFTPPALDFGTVNVGSSFMLSLQVTNTSAAPVTFSGLSATGDYTAAPGTCPSLGQALQPGATCTLQVTFAPSAAGTRNGVLSLGNSAGTLPLTASLTGNATLARLQVTPGALAFGAISVNVQATLTLTLLNTGTAPVSNISTSISGVNPTEFAVTTPCSVTTLAPNQGCTLTVAFTPSSTGPRSATLTVTSSDPNSPVLIPLTGNGAAVGDFSLSVAGGTAATIAVKSGSPASFPVLVTPLNGFTGAVALTCAPVTPAPYVTCSIAPSALTINGAPQTSVVTLNTITSASLQLPTSRSTRPPLVVFALLALPLFFCRKSRSMQRLALIFCCSIAAAAALTGCGGKATGSGGNGALYAPPGTYQYTVTASSTTGLPIQHTVTLNLIVQ